MIADSSFLIGLFSESDIFHQKAREDFASCETQTVVVADRVLEETMTVLTYKKGIRFAMEAVEKIQSNLRFKIVALNKDDCATIFALAKKTGRSLGFTDYAVAYLCCQERSFPLAYDKQLSSLVLRECQSTPGWAEDEILYGEHDPQARHYKPKK
ncbi:MAG: PIN domain-containing protein [Patescibacteria group bacterium]